MFETPAAICGYCYEMVDRAIVRQLFILRCQVRHLHEVTSCLKQDFEELTQKFEELSEPS